MRLTPTEAAGILQLYAEHNVEAAYFDISPTTEKIIAPTIDRTLNARVVHVEHLPSGRRRVYTALPGGNWLDSFAKDLKTGFWFCAHGSIGNDISNSATIQAPA